VVIETGLKYNVKTLIIMSPTIYGVGSGLFNRLSIQTPGLLRLALKTGESQVIGDGAGRWDHVHIADVVLLYEIILNNVLTGKDIPNGEKGIYFSGTGVHRWLDVSQKVIDAVHELGKSKTQTVKSVSLEECTVAPNKSFVELGFASNALTKADLARG